MSTPRCLTCNGQKVEATQMSINWQVDEHHGASLQRDRMGHKKERSADRPQPAEPGELEKWDKSATEARAFMTP